MLTRVMALLERGLLASSGWSFDTAEGHWFGWGKSVPTSGDSSVSAAPGCVFIHTDGSGVNDLVYVNTGSRSACHFDPIPVPAS